MNRLAATSNNSSGPLKFMAGALKDEVGRRRAQDVPQPNGFHVGPAMLSAASSWPC
jgi:hypothetical protein